VSTRIAGSAGGRRIKAPPGDSTRPTSDRVREALFSAIDSALGSLAGLRFLDVYAGSGAVGLEARSRGAGVVTLVEHDRRTAALIRDNARTLGMDGVEVLHAPASRALRQPLPTPFDVVFVDPPYDRPDLLAGALTAMESARPGGVLASDGLVVAKHDRRERPEAPEGLLASVRERRFGETALTFHRWRAAAAELTGEGVG